jgi:hypothetical protein
MSSSRCDDRYAELDRCDAGRPPGQLDPAATVQSTIRAVAAVSDDRLRVQSRNDKPSADRHPEPGELCGLVDHAMVLAGEVVTLDEQGRPDFGLLQQRSVRCCWP